MLTHYFTSVAVNYLPKARVLAQSIRQFDSKAKIHLVLCDETPPFLRVPNESFDRLWTLSELDIPQEPAWLFRHNLVELSTAAKSFALVRLLAEQDCSQIIYFDPDILITASLSTLLGEFDHASILLTPHVTVPEDKAEAIEDHEISSLRHGVFNLGFLGVKNSPEGLRFAHWWRDRSREFCRDDIPHGLYTDQRWADLVPALFPEQRILRHPGYNLCTWNLTHRRVTGSLADGLRVNGEPLVFYHFSGFDRGAQKLMLDKYGADMPALYDLRDWYMRACNAAGQPELGNARWAYGAFDDGTDILQAQRTDYRLDPRLPERFPNPYVTRTAGVSYRDWWNLHRSESTDKPALSPPISDASHKIEYDIFVLASKIDSTLLDETVRLIGQHSAADPEHCWLVTPKSAQRWEILPPGWRCLAAESASYSDLFAAVLQCSHSRDALIVRAGVRPPLLWDLRLAWSAVRSPDAVTISPVGRRALDPNAELSSEVTDGRLDGLCYWYRNAIDPEISTFTPDCVYVRSCVTSAVTPRELLHEARRLRYVHRMATHVFVAGETAIESDSGDAALLRNKLRTLQSVHSAADRDVNPARAATSPALHIMHSLRGGTEYWLSDFCTADTRREHLVLKSFGSEEHHATEWQLYRYQGDQQIRLRTWDAGDEPISAMANTHPRVREILREVVNEFKPGRVFVSSLIGHSLDAFRLGLPVTIVCHDYFPFCMALNITFGHTCNSCEPQRLQQCVLQNPLNSAFPNVPAAIWLELRAAFQQAVRMSHACFVAPSPSVVRNYRNLMPALDDRFHLIEHGLALQPLPLTLNFDADKRLRVVVIGQLLPLKGLSLFEELVPELLTFADVTLVGCGDSASSLAEQFGLPTVPSYKRAELPSVLQQVRPEVALLLSPTAETFSYTTRELQSLAVPTLATDRGSFVDWIDDGVTGFLAAPDAPSMLAVLRHVAKDKCLLRQVHENLRHASPPRSVQDMIADYEALQPTPYTAVSYFAGPQAPAPVEEKLVQLYWRTGESHQEINSTKVSPRGLGRQTLTLAIPPLREPLLGLRLDLATEPSLVRLYQLSLQDFQGKEVWRWNGDADFWRGLWVHQMALFQSDREGCSLALTGTDAHVDLPLTSEQVAVLEGGGELTVELAFDPHIAAPDGRTLQAILAEAIDDARVREQSERDRADDVQKEWELSALEAAATIRQLDTALFVSEGERRGMADSISWRLTTPLRKLKALVRP